MIDDNFETTKYVVTATLVVVLLSEILVFCLCETWCSNSVAKGFSKLDEQPRPSLNSMYFSVQFLCEVSGSKYIFCSVFFFWIIRQLHTV